MTQRIGLLFCCITRGLPCPPLFLLGVTCHAVVGCSLLPGLEGSARLWHLSSNVSHYELGSCETEAKLALSLDFWTLSSENLIGLLQFVRSFCFVLFCFVFVFFLPQEVLEDILDLDLSVSETDDFIQLASGEKIVFGSIPLAHRYGGHQFGIWAGQLGDGRAHLLGIYMNRQGEKWELQLKGSGKTPYSRNGDGRAVLRSSVREFLCSEAMHSLGIPTSRAARTLLDFIIQEHFPSVKVTEPNRYVDFFSIVVSKTAQLIALWMSVGFAHGVCNTDNFSLLSITIDYGPFGFMEAYNPDFVPNTSDDERRYKIGNQANVGMFNLNKLLQALNPLLDPRQKQLAAQILEGYPVLYYTRFRDLFKAKLGLLGERKGDDDLIAFLLHLMEKTEADFTMTFRQLSEITQSQLEELNIPQQFWALKMISEHKLFPAWVSQYLLRLKSNTNDSDSERRKRMTTVNPRYVLKNWMAESAVRKAERNDFSEVCLLQHVLQHPFQKHSAAEKAGYSSPTPSWAKDLRVSCSS
nr:uncharacterized protein LOC110577726 [Neomonachus schauinslandi]